MRIRITLFIGVRIGACYQSAQEDSGAVRIRAQFRCFAFAVAPRHTARGGRGAAPPALTTTDPRTHSPSTPRTPPRPLARPAMADPKYGLESPTYKPTNRTSPFANVAAWRKHVRRASRRALGAPGRRRARAVGASGRVVCGERALPSAPHEDARVPPGGARRAPAAPHGRGRGRRQVVGGPNPKSAHPTAADAPRVPMLDGRRPRAGQRNRGMSSAWGRLR